MTIEQIEEALKAHPEILAEFKRLALWVNTCIGAEIAEWNGPTVD